jgi:hypothetical protein
VVDTSACSNAWNNLGSIPGSTPIPVSSTSKRASNSPSRSSSKRTRMATEPFFVNFTALTA